MKQQPAPNYGRLRESNCVILVSLVACFPSLHLSSIPLVSLSLLPVLYFPHLCFSASVQLHLIPLVLTNLRTIMSLVVIIRSIH